MRKYLYLIFGLVGFYIFSVFGLKSLNESAFFAPIQNVVKERSINTAAFFYSENLFLTDSLDRDITIRHITKEKRPFFSNRGVR